MRGGTESLKKKNFLGGCVNTIFAMFSVGRVNSNRVHRMLGGGGGFTVHALELPSFGTENHYFSKGELWGFSFDVVSGGYCARQCGRMLRARWECVFACECVCVRARAGVRVTWQGHISQRAAGPDVWPPLTARSRRGWSGEGPAPSAPHPPDPLTPLRSPGQKPGPA